MAGLRLPASARALAAPPLRLRPSAFKKSSYFLQHCLQSSLEHRLPLRNKHQ
jgi:hypothetical protein